MRVSLTRQQTKVLKAILNYEYKDAKYSGWEVDGKRNFDDVKDILNKLNKGEEILEGQSGMVIKFDYSDNENEGADVWGEEEAWEGLTEEDFQSEYKGKGKRPETWKQICIHIEDWELRQKVKPLVTELEGC